MTADLSDSPESLTKLVINPPEDQAEGDIISTIVNLNVDYNYCLNIQSGKLGPRFNAGALRCPFKFIDAGSGTFTSMGLQSGQNPCLVGVDNTGRFSTGTLP